MMKRLRSRRLFQGGAAALLLVMAGDSAQTQVVSLAVGIDPLAILDLTISPNIAILIDTSGSMAAPFKSNDAAFNNPAIGGDDFSSKMYQAKKALRTVITANKGKANFGILSYLIRNADKTIAKNDYGAVGDDDRYVRYVSNQTTAAYWTGGNSTTGIDTTADFFGILSTSSTGNTGTTGAAVYGSFGAFTALLDLGVAGNVCTDANKCRWFLSSFYVRNNVLYTWTDKSTVTATAADCSADANHAPLDLFPDDPPLKSDTTKTAYNRPCVQMQFGATGAVTTFWYTSVSWMADSQCDGPALLAPVPSCTNNDPKDVLSQLKLQLPVDGTCKNKAGTATPEGFPCGITPTSTGTAVKIDGTNPAQDPNNMEGVLAGGNTPLSTSLKVIDETRDTVFPNRVTGQPNFVIVVTDGIDHADCDGGAATYATNLYNHGITVFVIAMGMNAGGADLPQLVYDIAKNGSNDKYKPFSAQVPEDLNNALSQIINQTASAGEFSDQQTITESVYEFGAVAGIDPLDPAVRYSQIIPLLLQSTFEMPEFVGHLKAFVNNGGTSDEVWDAGDKLCRQVTGSGAVKLTNETSKCNATAAHATAMGNGSFVFDALTGPEVATPYSPDGSARLKRRIFTTAGNGVFPYGTARQAVVPLWPPTRTNPGVDPDKVRVSGKDTYPIGQMDAALGLDAMTLTQLQGTFGACTGTDTSLPADCRSTADAALRLGKARKEAREMILAYAAGAVKTGTREATSKELLFKAKSWILGDATVSAAALITVPSQKGPSLFSPEYDLYRDGTGSTDDMGLGLGLRKPDATTSSPLKPVMSVVYYGANDMLHAFRAGPCALTCTSEAGGEELWGFVPFDQLMKLRLQLLEGQGRSNHKYMVATGLRFGDVFVPGVYTDPKNVSRSGKWRRLLFFGRGIAGTYYTALDVTNPGSLNTAALATRPPLPVWSRGNPDTQDGTATGADNYLTNVTARSRTAVDLGVPDRGAYATMGQTWSVPALTRVNRDNGEDPPTERNAGLDFMLYVGSGYGSTAGEGHNFYSINPLTGDILTSTDVGAGAISGTNAVKNNAIVANPVVFNRQQLVADVGHPADSVGTLVYVGDLHGRLWRFPTDNASDATTITPTLMYEFGVEQPIANPVALLYYATATGDPQKPHIYVETGNDRRVPTPTGGFQLAGLRDDGTAATLLFKFDLTDGYRGTTQPATTVLSKDASAAARVFFASTQYVSATAATCQSAFNSRLYVVGAGSGKAAFDMNNSGNVDDATDSYMTMGDTLVKAVQVAFGKAVVDKGLNAGDAPPPPAPPQSGITGSTQQVFVKSINAAGSPVCR